MVFRRLGDAFDLLRGEPFRQPRIFPDDPGGDIVVVLPSFAQPGIVEGGRREDDFRIGFRIGFRQVKRESSGRMPAGTGKGSRAPLIGRRRWS